MSYKYVMYNFFTFLYIMFTLHISLKMAEKRLIKELKLLKTDPPENISAGQVGSDLFNWVGVIIGPQGTPYENGIFRVSINFPTDYPFKPPHVKFITKVFHPNISFETGAICLDILKDKWTPNI